MTVLNPIYTELTQCQDCYKCIRECPIKAISVEQGHAKVIPDLCVLCGHCVMVCPSDAKRVRDDLPRARQLVKLKPKAVLSLAPSFASEFAGVSPQKITAAAKKLGFLHVSETAVGADFVSAEVASALRTSAEQTAAGDRSAQKLFLSSACPVAVEFVKQYLPELAGSVMDCASPLLAHARFLKQQFGQDCAVIFAGPCIAKKRESDVWQQDLDCAISFRDLRKWMEEEGVRLDAFPGEGAETFAPFRAAKGALYPMDGGMISSVKKYPVPEECDMLAVTGLDEIGAALKGIDPEKLTRPLFVELLACHGGCVNGPLASRQTPTLARHISLLNYAQDAADVTAEEHFPPMSGTLPAEAAPGRNHTEAEIAAALRSVGKFTVHDELNCGSCGYDTCRSFAAAMLDKRAEKGMCVSYMRKLAQKKANGLIKTIPAGVVICDSDLVIIECNENFARLMGPQIVELFEAKPGLEGAELSKITSLSKYFAGVVAENGPDVMEHEIRDGKKIFHATIFSLEKGQSACGVIQDITAPQVQRSRVIKQAQRVIDKNLAVVQKIAFLLGENAAETEATLNSIIESFVGSDEDEK